MNQKPPLVTPHKSKAAHPFSLIGFRHMMRSNFIHNLKSGILLDLTKEIEEHEIITRTGLEHALKEAEISVKSIDLFLADQLKDNSSLEQELRTVTQMKVKMEKELDVALKKMGDLKVDLFKKIESIRETMQCRNFLHTVSPQAWLREYQSFIERHKASCQPSIDKLDKEFGHFIEHMGEMDKELEKIVKEFIEIFQSSGPEILPFKEGKAISVVIKKMEKSNMEMLVHIRRLQKPLVEERKTLDGVSTVFKEEVNEVVRTLRDITGNYSYLKEGNARLESIIHDMMKSFREQVASEEVLKDKALLESLYKQVVMANKSKASATEMWKDIDEAFIDIRCKVGSFSKDEIERRRIRINMLNTKQLKDAKKARNRVLQMEQMVKGVRKAFWAPALPGTKRQMRPRSEPPPAPIASPPPPSPPGEDYTWELEYQSRLVQPLAASYETPRADPSSDKFSLRRDSIRWDEHDSGDPLDQSDSEDDPEDLSKKELLEIPRLPAVEKFITPSEDEEQSECAKK